MKPCRECSREISEQEMSCPHCGSHYPAKAKCLYSRISPFIFSFKYRPNKETAHGSILFSNLQLHRRNSKKCCSPEANRFHIVTRSLSSRSMRGDTIFIISVISSESIQRGQIKFFLSCNIGLTFALIFAVLPKAQRMRRERCERHSSTECRRKH